MTLIFIKDLLTEKIYKQIIMFQISGFGKNRFWNRKFYRLNEF